MIPKKLNDNISVSVQLTPECIIKAKQLGFKSIICNRPDDEEENQPSFNELARTAKQQGIVIQHMPVASLDVAMGDIKTFTVHMENLPKPILAFCKTGTRAATLWAKSQLEKLDDEEILQCCHSAGYLINLS